MKTRIIISIVITVVVHTLSFSQSKHVFNAETQGGYEYNYFKSPEEVRVNDSVLTKEDLIASSIYQDILANYIYTNKWDRKNRIRFFVKPSARIFYENIDDSYWSANLRAKYDYKFNKNVKLLAETKLIRMNREGLGGDQDVLINPLGYTLYGVNAGVDFNPFVNNKLITKVFYNFKDFDAFGIRDLQFDEFGLEVSNVQTFKVGKLKHKLGINAYAKKRLYDTFNASEVITDGERDWDYVKATLFYQLPFSEQFQIKPTLTYYTRVDNSTDRSGFNQFGPGILLKYKSEKTTINGSFSFITRNYSSIEARNTDGRIGEKLTYEYANFGVNASHDIGNGFSITAKINSRIRSTNYTDIDARSFRNYRNQYAGIGILWKL
ncbi:hypothetical protein [Aquimarina algiphila]|uniref:hypothetical protein n=1 Tax=Aquimarina algiphila TaxID=2047982 RepID=UPI002330CF14|nr:hypothetical protein [Aquimarina algiphila]